jgi:hypothetical protein
MALVLLNASAKDAHDQILFHIVSQGPYGSRRDVVGIALLLLEHGTDVNAQDMNHATMSDSASKDGIDIEFCYSITGAKPICRSTIPGSYLSRGLWKLT